MRRYRLSDSGTLIPDDEGRLTWVEDAEQARADAEARAAASEEKRWENAVKIERVLDLAEDTLRDLDDARDHLKAAEARIAELEFQRNAARAWGEGLEQDCARLQAAVSEHSTARYQIHDRAERLAEAAGRHSHCWDATTHRQLREALAAFRSPEPQPAAEPEPKEEAVRASVREFVRNMRDLSGPEREVLYRDLWDLYDDEPQPAAESEPHPTQDEQDAETELRYCPDCEGWHCDEPHPDTVRAQAIAEAAEAIDAEQGCRGFEMNRRPMAAVDQCAHCGRRRREHEGDGLFPTSKVSDPQPRE